LIFFENQFEAPAEWCFVLWVYVGFNERYKPK